MLHLIHTGQPDLTVMVDWGLKISDLRPTVVVVVVDRFSIALFSALEQTHCVCMRFYMNDYIAFHSAFLNSHRSGVLTALVLTALVYLLSIPFSLPPTPPSPPPTPQNKGNEKSYMFCGTTPIHFHLLSASLNGDCRRRDQRLGRTAFFFFFF